MCALRRTGYIFIYVPETAMVWYSKLFPDHWTTRRIFGKSKWNVCYISTAFTFESNKDESATNQSQMPSDEMEGVSAKRSSLIVEL